MSVNVRWRLKEDDARTKFRDKVQEKYDAGVNMVTSANDISKKLKGCLLEGADEVCGRTKGSSRHKVSWWWNSDCDKAVKEKCTLYMAKEKTKSMNEDGV